MIDNRLHDRFDCDDDIMFARQLVHPYCYYGGATLNYSVNGICLVSRYEAPIGDNLCLRLIGKHLHSSATLDELTCMAEVRWCRPVTLNEQSSLYYLGLHYLGGQVPSRFTPWQNPRVPG